MGRGTAQTSSKKSVPTTADDDMDYDFDADRAFGPKERRICGILLALQAVLLIGWVHVAQRYVSKDALNATSTKEEPAPAVNPLTEATLPLYIAGLPDGLLVNFHTSSCSHCELLAPEFEKAALELRSRPDGPPLASVNAALAPKAVEKYGVERFPTMIWFRRGEAVGEAPKTARTADKVIEYVDWVSQPPVVEFETLAELTEATPLLRAALSETSPPVIVGFEAPGVRDALQATGDRLRGKTVFLFIKEAWPHGHPGPRIRAYFSDEAADVDYEGPMVGMDVYPWVAGLLAKKARQTSD